MLSQNISILIKHHFDREQFNPNICIWLLNSIRPVEPDWMWKWDGGVSGMGLMGWGWVSAVPAPGPSPVPLTQRAGGCVYDAFEPFLQSFRAGNTLCCTHYKA